MPPTDPQMPAPDAAPAAGGPPQGAPMPQGGAVTMEMPVETFAVMAKLAEQLHGAFQAASEQIQKQAGAQGEGKPSEMEKKPETNPQAEGADDADLENFAKDLNKKRG